jgi:SAM-dependent methyltransferase
MPIPLIPFRRPTLKQAPLPVTMSGVRMGERLLQIGIDDLAIAGGMAAKVGVTGRAAFLVPDERAAARAQKAVEAAMALAEIQVAPLGTFPFPPDAFDVIVVNARKGALAVPPPATLADAFRNASRVLRPGGRLITLEDGTPTGLGAWLRSARREPAQASDTVAALQQAGFTPVRVLADREGYLFTEGLKPKA